MTVEQDCNKFLHKLPRSFVGLWLWLWAGFFILFALLFFMIFKITDANALSLWFFVVVKFIIYGLMGGCVGGLVAFRFLQPVAISN